MSWSPFQDYVVTCGIKHLMFWSTSPFQARKALFNRRGKMQTMLCCCFPGPDTTVVGTQDGSLYLFKGYQLATNMRKCHQVTHAVHATRDVIISGGKEGKVKFWTVDLMQCLRRWRSVIPRQPPRASRRCTSRAACSSSGRELARFTRWTPRRTRTRSCCKDTGTARCGDWRVTRTEHQYVTVGDDCTCRVWDVASRRMVMVRDLGAKGRSVAYHPDGSQIAIGLAGGGLVVLSADSLDTMHAKKDREEPIHELKYSPNGQYLAAGSHDNYIDVYDVGKNYGRTGVAKGHASYIRHLDWSQDSTVMQSNSGDFEMLFWEMPSGNRSSSRRTRETSTGPRGRAWCVCAGAGRLASILHGQGRAVVRPLAHANGGGDGRRVRPAKAVSVSRAQGLCQPNIRWALVEGDASAIYVR